MALVMQSPCQRADESGSGSHGHISLIQGINQMDVHAVAFIAKRFTGLEADQGNRNFKHGAALQRQAQQAMGFIDNFLMGLPERLHLEFRHHPG